jgi:Domain of unknown function (DUF5655)
MIFAAVNKLSERGLDAHVVLRRRLERPRFRRIDTITSHCFVHHFRVESLNELDEEVRSWLREAYQVGAQSDREGVSGGAEGDRTPGLRIAN